jgi:hypothetical protein
MRNFKNANRERVVILSAAKDLIRYICTMYADVEILRASSSDALRMTAFPVCSLKR